MEQGSFLPFSSLIASMLLFKNRITSVEIINLTSLLAQYNIFIDDEIDNMDIFSTCVICNNYSYFEIRDDASYDSILSDGKTVWDFFMENANKDIVDVIIKTNYYPICGKNNLCYSVVLPKKKIKSKFLNRIFNFF